MNKRYGAHALSKRGMTPLEQLQVRELAHKRDTQIQKEVYKRMIVVPVMVLKEYYWRNEDKEKFAEFFQYMMDLYESFGDDYTLEDAMKYLEDVMEVKLEEL